ncbi:MAG: NAD-dependent epimerase/dehydratase family protein [Dehalococcoidia bacterium]
MPSKKMLVAGASGLVGHAAIDHFRSLPGWEVVGASRRLPADLPGAELVSVDLADTGACERVFGQMADVTHLIYAALHEIPGLMPGWTDEDTIERNGLMLRNLFKPLARVAAGLEHVSLLHGTKAYGLHHPDIGLNGLRNPLRERDPRRPHRNFYFVQEDYLREKQAGGRWTLTTWRPTVIYGDAPGNNMNPIPPLAAYAAVLKARGEPLYFPGQPGAQSLREAVDADLVAHALAWATTAPAAAGETFNVTNGDVFIWDNVWPAIAGTLGMEPGEARPFSFANDLPAWEAEWSAIVDKHGLRSPRNIVEFAGYNSLVYTDVMLAGGTRPGGPILNSTIHLREAGFHECMDSEDMFRKLFRQMQDSGQLPPADAR